MLSYPYKEGSFHPRSVVQIVNVIQSLHSIHSRGYIHGDIRVENLIYCSNGNDVYIIDYDFCRREGDCYPECYNECIAGRHKNARPWYNMEKFHDLQALHYCIVQQYGYLTRREHIILQSLRYSAMGTNIADIVQCLEKLMRN